MLASFSAGGARMTLAGNANREAGDGDDAGNDDDGGEVVVAASSVGEAIAITVALAVVDDADEAAATVEVAGGATPWPYCRAQTARSPPSMVVV